MNDVDIRLNVKKTTPTVEEATRSAEESFNRMGSSIAATAAKIGAAMAGAFAVNRIIAFGKESVRAASEAEDAERKYEAMRRASNETTGIAIDQMKELAAEIQRTTKHEDDHVVAVAATLLRYNNLKEDVFPRVIRLAADMSEVFGSLEGAATSLGRSLNDPSAGMRILRMAGVELTDSFKKSIQEMEETGNKAGAMNLILEELEKRFKGVATEMGDTFSGKLAKLSNQFGDIKEDIGSALIPAIERVLPFLERFGKELRASMKIAAEEIDKVGSRGRGGGPQFNFNPFSSGWWNNASGGFANLDLVSQDIMGFALGGNPLGNTKGGGGTDSRTFRGGGKYPTLEEFLSHLAGTAAGMRAQATETMEQRMKETGQIGGAAPGKAPKEKRDYEYERLFGGESEDLEAKGAAVEKRVKEMLELEDTVARIRQEGAEKWRKMEEDAAAEREKFDKFADWKASPDKPNEFKSTIEGMGETFRRISMSAASREERPEDKIVKVTKEEMGKVAEKLDKAAEVLKPIAPALDNLPKMLGEELESMGAMV